MKENRRKVSKVIFIISFIPYIIMILFALYYAIAGEEIYTFLSHEYIRTDYGIEVFMRTMYLLIYLGTVVVPILPILIAYQFIVILRVIIAKIKKCQNRRVILKLIFLKKIN